jgi:hypothetical protein
MVVFFRSSHFSTCHLVSLASFCFVFFSFFLVLRSRRGVAVGGVGDGETGSARVCNIGNLNKLGVLYANKQSPRTQNQGLRRHRIDVTPLFIKMMADRRRPHCTYFPKLMFKDSRNGSNCRLDPSTVSRSRNWKCVLKAFLEVNLDKHFILQSSFTAIAPVLFGKKRDGSLR